MLILLLLAVVKAGEADVTIYDKQDEKYVTLEGPKTNLDLSSPCRQGEFEFGNSLCHQKHPNYSHGQIAQVIRAKDYAISTEMEDNFSADSSWKIYCPAVQYSNSAWTFGTATNHIVSVDDQEKDISQKWSTGEDSNGKHTGAYLQYDDSSKDYKMYSFNDAERATLELFVLCKGKSLD